MESTSPLDQRYQILEGIGKQLLTHTTFLTSRKIMTHVMKILLFWQTKQIFKKSCNDFRHNVNRLFLSSSIPHMSRICKNSVGVNSVGKNLLNRRIKGEHPSSSFDVNESSIGYFYMLASSSS